MHGELGGPRCFRPGVVGAVVLPVTGAATGVAQVVRGIANQNEAAKAESEGKVWNHVSSLPAAVPFINTLHVRYT